MIKPTMSHAVNAAHFDQLMSRYNAKLAEQKKQAAQAEQEELLMINANQSLVGVDLGLDVPQGW